MEKLIPLAKKVTWVRQPSPRVKYPPELSEEQASTLISDIKDYQLIHGSLLKLVQSEQDNTVLSQPVGISVFPTLFPKTLFEEALALQRTYNKLYTAVAEDEDFSFRVLEGLIENDPLATCLWGIYEEVKKEGSVQDLSLGIWRNDYMLDIGGSQNELGIKQVEFNTIAVAGGTHGNRVSDMHQHLQATGAYRGAPGEQDQTIEITASSLPPNNTIQTITSGLVAAHSAYGPPKAPSMKQTCILFIVQPHNFNIADERPLEYALWSSSPPIPAYRLLFGADVLEYTTVTPSRELIYHPPSRPGLALEVSVVYFRSGFEVHEYNYVGRTARLHLERSRAIKCPNLLGHLCTFKKVQQALSRPGALKIFLRKEEVDRIEKTFTPMFPLDESKKGMEGRKIATNGKVACDYVLKPSLEGGGHNIYGSAIPEYLKGVAKEKWGGYVLMKKILPPSLNGILMSQRGIYEGSIVSELGIFGVCLWRRNEGVGQEKAEIVKELAPSWSFKTKDASVDEMSVVKGYGCFDSPVLVDLPVFAAVAGWRTKH
ncbi:Glutathione synthetase large chain [Hyphodiscus hymeniophilus]|uniref:Glutathione synthetase n=1 Tax=Hyphodiscus hymeniophilus TaxID=353542 RepID=A0A9P7AYG3_9HELO|nr:Glutathione synthetase large chain [Hyphodiscus hymeniophilus]